MNLWEPLRVGEVFQVWKPELGRGGGEREEKQTVSITKPSLQFKDDLRSQIQKPATHIQLPVRSAVQSMLTAAWAMTHWSLPPWEHSCCLQNTLVTHAYPAERRIQVAKGAISSDGLSGLKHTTRSLMTSSGYSRNCWFMVPERGMNCAKWWWIMRFGRLLFFFFWKAAR